MKNLLLFFLIIFTFQSCVIQKRQFRKGYTINWNKNFQKDEPETQRETFSEEAKTAKNIILPEKKIDDQAIEPLSEEFFIAEQSDNRQSENIIENLEKSERLIPLDTVVKKKTWWESKKDYRNKEEKVKLFSPKAKLWLNVIFYGIIFLGLSLYFTLLILSGPIDYLILALIVLIPLGALYILSIIKFFKSLILLSTGRLTLQDGLNEDQIEAQSASRSLIWGVVLCAIFLIGAVILALAALINGGFAPIYIGMSFVALLFLILSIREFSALRKESKGKDPSMSKGRKFFGIFIPMLLLLLGYLILQSLF